MDITSWFWFGERVSCNIVNLTGRETEGKENNNQQQAVKLSVYSVSTEH